MNVKSKKGFTLIELLAVIAIIAIIVAIAYPNIVNTFKNMKLGALVVKENDVINNAKIYVSDCLDPKMRNTLSGCSNVNLETTSGTVNLSDIISDKYMKEVEFENNSCDGYVTFENEQYKACLNCGEKYRSDDISCNFSNQKKAVRIDVTGGSASPSLLSVEHGGSASSTITPNGSLSLADATVTCDSGITGVVTKGKLKLSNVISSGKCLINIGYSEEILHGTDPVLKGDLIPIILTSTDEDWTVKYADVKKEWYKYNESEWANAVRLIETPSKIYSVGDTIDHEDIGAYFVWIPRYKYKLFNMGNYDSLTTGTLTAKNQLIDIAFGTDTTEDTLVSCKTPMESGASGNCAVGKYMTHPAFISFNSNGFWVGKFEPTGTIDALTVSPSLTALKNATISTLFTTLYNYNRELDSHLIKNTEWGAIAYITNSIYGRKNTELYKNNSDSYETGCVESTNNSGANSNCQNQWYSLAGFNGSTTGNITGIYDMAAGAWEYMASYIDKNVGSSGLTIETISSYNVKYFDVYNTSSSVLTYKYRILGDATGEMGPFGISPDNSNYNIGSWYGDYSHFLEAGNPWFVRGGYKNRDILSGVFAFAPVDGDAKSMRGCRLILTP